MDALTEVFSRLPWWSGLIAVAVVYGGVYLLAGQFELLSPGRKTYAGLAGGLVGLTAIFGQVLKLTRRDTLRIGSSLDGIRSLSWRRFEELVGEAFRREGYGVEPTAAGADGGVDLILRKGGETIFVQCKAWRSKQVGVERLRELFGVVAAEGADAAILVTSGSFTRAAQEFADGRRMRLVDGPQLATMLAPVRKELPPQPGFPPAHPPCPHCGSEMTLRTARKGPHSGTQFLGCTRYPTCKGTRNLTPT